MIENLGVTESYHIYIGMNDREKLRQLISTEDFIGMVRDICIDNRIAFSLHDQVGGYLMENGNFIHENSLVLIVTGFTQDQIFMLAEELRKRLRQEAVLISKQSPEMFLLKD